MEQYAPEMTGQIMRLLPAGYDRAVFLGKVYEQSTGFVYYAREESTGEYKSAEGLIREGYFDSRRRSDVYSRMCSIMRRTRNRMTQPFESFTFCVDRSGKFTIDYDYRPAEPGLSQAWKQRYLTD